MRVQAFRAESAIERFDDRILCGLAGPGEVDGDAALLGPEVNVARQELTALINSYGLGIHFCQQTRSSVATTSSPR